MLQVQMTMITGIFTNIQIALKDKGNFLTSYRFPRLGKEHLRGSCLSLCLVKISVLFDTQDRWLEDQHIYLEM